jgi:hypothetical protein
MARCCRVLAALPARVQRLHLVSGVRCLYGATTVLAHPSFTAKQAQRLDEYHELYEPDDEYVISLINNSQRQEVDQASRARSHQLAAALGRSPAAAHLAELLVDWEMLPAGAEHLLRACPALERLRLTVAT